MPSPTYSSTEDIKMLDVPRKFLSITNIRETVPGSIVSVIGMITDYQEPIKTRGTGEYYKCSITIFDMSTQDETPGASAGIQASFFDKSRDRLPQPATPGDVVLFHNIKVQQRSGYHALLSSSQTECCILKAGTIPTWPNGAGSVAALTPALRSGHLKSLKGMNQFEISSTTEYIIWFKSFVNQENMVPTSQEYARHVAQSSSQREKFSLAKDLQPGNFYDFVGQIISIFSQENRTFIYISDYTANSLFVSQETLVPEAGFKDGDDYGYLADKLPMRENKWDGPPGKMSLLVTAWDGQARFVMDNQKSLIGSFVILKNINIKIAKSGNLEADLRDDRKFAGKANITLLNVCATETLDPRVKEALRRKRDLHKKLSSSFKSDKQSGHGSKKNGRKRRQDVIKACEDEITSSKEKALEKLHLNPNVICTNQESSTTPLTEIMNWDDNRLPNGDIVPFQNLKYRANIRIIDFRPHDLKHFVVGRSKGEFDCLSDNSDGSGGESTDNSGDTRARKEGKGFGTQSTWEWRFHLLVEDADLDSAKCSNSDSQIWLGVNNENAQFLLNMDAKSPNQSPELIEELREKLFTAWGDLEEKKSAFLKTTLGSALLEASGFSMPKKRLFSMNYESSEDEDHANNPPSKKIKKSGGNEPPPDTDEEDNSSAVKHTVNRVFTTTNRKDKANDISPIPVEDEDEDEELKEIREMGSERAKRRLAYEIQKLDFKNKGLTVCVQQYGIKIPSERPELANAGMGQRYQRMFALYGTRIR